MKLLALFCLFALLVSLPHSGFSQKEIEISGVKYVLHTVTKSETVFSLCQKYNVTQKELHQANPGLTAVLQAGTTVKIPVGKVAAEPKKEMPPVQKAAEEEFYYHKVSQKQTIFSIAKQYGITANDLIRYNPEVTNGLKEGEVLKIPVRLTEKKDSGAQQADAVPTKEPVPSDYNVHQVVSGETLYSLEQRYGIAHEEMMKWNPELGNGLKAGMKLKIPVKSATQPVDTVAPSQSVTKYQVEKGETLFSISTRFGVEVSELKKANPSLLSRSLEAGETILIPQQSTQTTGTDSKKSLANAGGAEKSAVQETSGCTPLSGRISQKYKVALLLPFNLPGNDQVDPLNLDKTILLSKVVTSKQQQVADTSMVLGFANIDPKIEGFLEFYEGALLAIDSLQNKGMKIELYVFDAGNQKMIDGLLQLDEFRDMNLIIGPVYPELQVTVASFAAKNRIPMISPLSPAGNLEQNNSFYFKVNPDKEYQLEQTANYAGGEFANKNFILLQVKGNSSSQEAKLGELMREKLGGKSAKNLFHEYSFQQQGVNEIKPLLDETGENIFMIPTDNEAQVSIAITNLNALAEHYNIVLMATPSLIKLKSLQTESFHRIRLRYLSPYFTDYNSPLVRRFVGQYREIFSDEPTQFSFQGFDVSYYFLSALYRFGKDFRNCLPDYPMELTQMAFHFSKVAPMGGFMNKGLFVTAYERNFDVVSYGTLGGK